MTPGRWSDPPILPELPPPPEHLIRVRGAQLVRVYNVDAPNPGSRGGWTQALALAWARLPSGDWAALLAWLSGWHEDGRTTGKGRYGWCRILPDRTRAVAPRGTGGTVTSGTACPPTASSGWPWPARPSRCRKGRGRRR